MKINKILFILLFCCCSMLTTKAQQSSEANPYKGKVIAMDDKMFREKIFDYQSDDKWKYRGDRPAVIDFYASWCPPCKMIAPILSSLAKSYQDSIYIYKVDIDSNRALAEYFNITSIPMVLFVPMQGQAEATLGANDKKFYNSMIEKMLKKR